VGSGAKLGQGPFRRPDSACQSRAPVSVK
jgi:hypothetical protein